VEIFGAKNSSSYCKNFTLRCILKILPLGNSTSKIFGTNQNFPNYKCLLPGHTNCLRLNQCCFKPRLLSYFPLCGSPRQQESSTRILLKTGKIDLFLGRSNFCWCIRFLCLFNVDFSGGKSRLQLIFIHFIFRNFLSTSWIQDSVRTTRNALYPENLF
jgi:hypothetical protein